MAAEVASAFVSLVPSAKGFGRATERTVGGQMAGAGRKIGGLLGSTLKKGALGVVGAAGGVLGVALFSGFKRLNAIDQAKAKLTGLGHTTKSVNKIMDNALKSVKGTAFGLDEAATVSASAVAAGVKPGKDLTRTLKLVADAATISGTSMSDMGSIFNKVAATGKVSSREIMQLGAQGIPILQMLGKSLKVTPQQVSEMARKGKIGFDDFRKAMKQGLGGAALESGKTFTGAFKNMKASLGRIGANLLSSIFPQIHAGIGGLTGILSGLEPVATRVGTKVGEVLGRAAAAIGPLTAKARDLLPHLQGIAQVTWGKLQSGIEALKKLTELDFSKIDGKALGTQLGKAIADGLTAIGGAAKKIGKVLGDLFAKVDWVGIGITIGKQAPALALGLAAGLLNFDFGSLLRGIGDHWFEILMGVLAIAFAPAKFLGPLTKVLTKIPFVGRFLAAAVRWLNELGGKLVSFGGDMLRYFWRGFTESPLPGAGFVSKVIGALKALPGRVRDFFSLLKVRVGVWALDAFEAMGRGARGAGGRVVGFLASLPMRFLRALGKLANLLFPGGRELISGVLRGIQGRIGAVLNFLRGLRAKFIGGLKGAASWLVEAGKDLIRGLINGIKNMAGAAVDAAKGVAKSAIDGAKHLLGIHSPSRVFHKIGEHVSQGLANGILAGKKKVLAHLKTLLSAAKEAFSKVKGFANDLRSSITEAFTHDIFGNGAAGLLAQLRADTNDSKAFGAALKKYKGSKKKGSLFQALAASGDLQTAQQLATMSKAELRKYERAYAARNKSVKAVGNYAVQKTYGAELARTRHAVEALTKQVKTLGKEVEAGARTGTRQGITDRGKQTSARTRTGK